jgi:hypothetical protein
VERDVPRARFVTPAEMALVSAVDYECEFDAAAERFARHAARKFEGSPSPAFEKFAPVRFGGRPTEPSVVGHGTIG